MFNLLRSFRFVTYFLLFCLFFFFHFSKYFIGIDLIAFPLKDSFKDSSGLGELCSICYTYRFDGQIPIVSCDNEKCGLNYHLICLKEWFTTLRDTKVFLNMASGRCPSCKEVCIFNFVFFFGSIHILCIL